MTDRLANLWMGSMFCGIGTFVAAFLVVTGWTVPLDWVRWLMGGGLVMLGLTGVGAAIGAIRAAR